MNRRDFFSAFPALAISPLTPVEKTVSENKDFVAGDIAVFTGEKFVVVGEESKETDHV